MIERIIKPEEIPLTVSLSEKSPLLALAITRGKLTILMRKNLKRVINLQFDADQLTVTRQSWVYNYKNLYKLDCPTSVMIWSKNKLTARVRKYRYNFDPPQQPSLISLDSA